MATVTPTMNVQVDGFDDLVRVTWVLTNGDDGAPVPDAQFADRSVQVFGTFGTGGTVIWEGTNTAASSNYNTLNDPLGNAISFTGAGAKQIHEIMYQSRPRCTAGDGTTSITVVAFLRRQQPARV